MTSRGVHVVLTGCLFAIAIVLVPQGHGAETGGACGETATPAAEARTGTAPSTETAGPTRALGLFKPGEPVPLEEGFRDPPPISRAQCWWQCHGSALTKEEITRQLEAFQAAGMGGVTIKDTLPMPRDAQTAHLRDVPFMSPEWLDLFAHVVAECGRLGLICRSRLGSGWNAGGPWVEPEMSSQVLTWARSEPIPGPGEYRGPIPLSPDGQPTLHALRSDEAFVLAVPEPPKTSDRAIDLTGKVTPERTLTWTVPNGSWRLLSFFSAPSGTEVMSASPSGGGLHHDHLSAAGTDLQLRMVAEPMLARLGTFEGTAFDGFNCDSWELGKPTWTPGFRQAFRSHRGYDPVPHLPALLLVEDDRFHAARVAPGLGEIDRRFLHDLRTTVSDLIVETHYQRASRWCRRHGVALEAEAGGGPGHSLPKDLLRASGAVDVPMGEFWMGGRSYVKIASSAAHAYGKRLVGLESFTETGNHFGISPARMKARADEAFLLGGNYLTIAVTEYSPVEAGRPGWVHNAGPHLNPCQTWWPMARPFFDYLARCSFLLQSGENVAHAAVYYTFRTAGGELWAAPKDDDLAKRSKRFAFDYVGDDLVQDHMHVRDGRVVLDSGASYPVLYVIPTPPGTMPLATLAKIRDLARDGATVVWAGDPPKRCPGLTGYPQCDVQLRAIADDLWQSGRLITLPKHDDARLAPILEAGPDPPAWQFPDQAPLRLVHRRTRRADVFFVVNRATWAVDVPVVFRIRDRVCELWDPETGRIERATCRQTDDGTEVPVRLPPEASVFVVFRQPSGAAPRDSSPRRIIDSLSRPPHVGEAPGPVQPLSIEGPWELAFPEGGGAPPKRTLDRLQSWTEVDDPGVRHFSGIATYRTSFDCPAELGDRGLAATLDLGEVREVAELRLNGKTIGTGWHPPYRLDVTDAIRPGENRLEVRVANLWHNRIVGDASLPEARRVTRMVPKTHYDRLRGKPLIPSGLLGPVRVVFRSPHKGIDETVR
jgi:hypothetical protein